MKQFHQFLLYANSGIGRPVISPCCTKRYSEITDDLLVLVAPPSALQFSPGQVEQAVCFSWYYNQDWSHVWDRSADSDLLCLFSNVILTGILIWFLRMCKTAQFIRRKGAASFSCHPTDEEKCWLNHHRLASKWALFLQNWFHVRLTLSAGPQKSPYLILLGNYSRACHDESTIIKVSPQASAALVFSH